MNCHHADFASGRILVALDLYLIRREGLQETLEARRTALLMVQCCCEKRIQCFTGFESQTFEERFAIAQTVRTCPVQKAGVEIIGRETGVVTNSLNKRRQLGGALLDGLP